MTVLRYKSAKYSIERPLHIGAALAGAGPETMARADGVRAAARRGLPAARRPARRLRRPGRHRQAGGRRPDRGQADRAGRAGPRRRAGATTPPASTPRSAARSTRTRWPSCAAIIDASGAHEQVEAVIGELPGSRSPRWTGLDVDDGARRVLRELASAATDRVV